MNKHLIICNIFFISLIRGKMIPSLTTATKTIFPVVSTLLEKNEDSTHKVLSEAGSITHLNAATLPSNDMALINLEKKGSVPKKGVNYEDGIKSHNDKLPSYIGTFLNEANITKKPDPTQAGNTILNSTNIPNDDQKINSTKIHKPLVLSSEAIAKMDKINNVTINKSDNGPSIKAHVVKAGSHPKMIVPIVITILVVPMFAVVGYMALKRGQEAWKNRHYKRMDFLLDGMYND